MKKLLRNLFNFKPYEVIDLEQKYYDKQLLIASQFAIKCIKSCQTKQQLLTCSHIMHTYITVRHISNPLYIKYWNKVCQHYHFRLKYVDLIESINKQS